MKEKAFNKFPWWSVSVALIFLGLSVLIKYDPYLGSNNEPFRGLIARNANLIDFFLILLSLLAGVVQCTEAAPRKTLIAKITIPFYRSTFWGKILLPCLGVIVIINTVARVQIDTEERKREANWQTNLNAITANLEELTQATLTNLDRTETVLKTSRSNITELTKKNVKIQQNIRGSIAQTEIVNKANDLSAVTKKYLNKIDTEKIPKFKNSKNEFIKNIEKNYLLEIHSKLNVLNNAISKLEKEYRINTNDWSRSYIQIKELMAKNKTVGHFTNIKEFKQQMETNEKILTKLRSTTLVPK